ncbi:hypothetical protein BBJ28_00003835 [Nothophytophthora sp. Chile5]|nr:hypothetical protein BBJ28_00003835 [Nothophytophthora sp. Chile5]
MWRRSGTALSQRLALSEEVAEALYGRLKKPVVALESTIISHGMPFPQNLEMATHVEDIVRAHGACPATICIADGSLKVGLSKEDLNQLAELGAAAKKCSTRDIAAAVTDKSVVGATTVSSTMYVPTLHVPVIGYQTDQFPAFFTQDSGEKAHLRRDTPQDVARLIYESAALELPNGHIIAVPNPKPVPTEMINSAIELGLKEVVEKHISGQAVTPYLLKRVNEITQGVSLGSNIDLVNSNATVGSQVGAAPSNAWFAVNLMMPFAFAAINIAECLHRLEMDPLLVSSVGNDASGSILLENLKQLGLDASGIQISDELATAVYSAVLDSTGDLDAAIADMRAFEAIESSAISDKAIEDSKLVIADGNLSPNTLGNLFKRSASLGVSVWFEPTSVQKALRVVEGDAVSATTYMSPNADELHAIGNAIRQKLKEAGASPSHTSAHEHFLLTKESCIIPKERMTRLKDDLITGTWCMFSFLSLS